MMNCLNYGSIILVLGEFPNLIEYYTTVGNGTLLKEAYTTFENHRLLKDIDNLMYHSQLNFSEDTPKQILHILSTLILWSKISTLLLANILPYMISWPSHLRTYPIRSITLIIPTNVQNQTFSDLLYPCMSGQHLLIHLNQGRCHIVCTIQVNTQMCPSVIPSVP